MAAKTKTKETKIKVDFRLMAPEANSVKLAGDFTDWETGSLELKKLKSGLWKKTVNLTKGTYQYRFLVDGNWQDDPEAQKVSNDFGSSNCVCVVA